MADTFFQKLSVIILSGNVMASAEINPFHPVHVRAELLFHRFQGVRKGIGILFAQGMKMKPLNSIQ